MNTEFRFGKKRFYDDQRFKRGFNKSGEFTLLESELLSLYGDTMQALNSGEIMPENAEEQHFLLVCSQQLEPESKLEKVWMKYKRLTQSRRAFHTLNSRCKVASYETEDESEDDNFISDDD